jgi:hypothetical protein
MGPIDWAVTLALPGSGAVLAAPFFARQSSQMGGAELAERSWASLAGQRRPSLGSLSAGTGGPRDGPPGPASPTAKLPGTRPGPTTAPPDRAGLR